MFAHKKKYFLIIENTRDLDLQKIKKRNKFSVIYRNFNNIDNRLSLLKFRRACKVKGINFYVANDLKLAKYLNSNGVYLSAYNKSLNSLKFKSSNFEIIGSAHNSREIAMKVNQGCSSILLSKLFIVDYDKKASHLGVVKFNNYLKINKLLIPLGGINLSNLNNLSNVNSIGFALLSEIKKKPTKIISRLF